MSTHSSHYVSKRFCTFTLCLLIGLFFGGCGASLNSTIINGDFSQAKEIIMKGEGLEEKDQLGRTPLMNATKKGNLDLVVLLIQKGANIEAKDKELTTALHIAAQQNETAILELLIKSGADVHVTNWGGGKRLGLGQMRIKYGADVMNSNVDTNVYNGGEGTPLTIASRKGNLEVVKLLVKAGADVNAIFTRQTAFQGSSNDLGSSPLSSAMLAENNPIADYLIEHGAQNGAIPVNPNIEDKWGPATNRVAQSHKNYARYLANKSEIEKAKKHYAEAAVLFEKASTALKETSMEMRGHSTQTGVISNLSPISLFIDKSNLQKISSLTGDIGARYTNLAIEALVNSRKCLKILDCYKNLAENDNPFGECHEKQ